MSVAEVTGAFRIGSETPMSFGGRSVSGVWIRECQRCDGDFKTIPVPLVAEVCLNGPCVRPPRDWALLGQS
jgi:hypothetical protein